jgi:hypothetical protein
MATFALSTLSCGAPNITSATTKPIVVAQFSSVRHGYIVVGWWRMAKPVCDG